MGCDEKLLQRILNEPKKLSPDQKKAVLAEKRYVRIVAGAGAGKTETLTRRIVYLLLCKNVDPSSIVAFTFTEKAAQSMKSRVYTRISSLAGESYTAQLGKMYIGTIHSYALRILQDYFGYGNYDVFDENQEMAFVLRKGFELGIYNIPARLNYGKKCKMFVDAVNVVYDEMISRDNLQEKNPGFYKLLQKYEKLLNENHRLTFGRMIYLAVEELKKHPEIISKKLKIKHLIVDEYQDINLAQEKLIELLGKYANIFVVGDPRQTIYQWRGSDDECFERFLEKYSPEVKPITIPENRRSGENIVKVGNAIASKFKRQFKPMKSINNYGGKVYVIPFETKEEEAKRIVTQIERLQKELNLKYSDFGILLRSVKVSGDPFIRELKKRGIPYIVGGKVGLFKREETKAVGKLFAWLSPEGFWRESRKRALEGDKLLQSALEDWENVTGFSLSSTIKDELEKWKQDVINGKYSAFQNIYHDLLKILGYLNLDPNNKLHAAIMANLGRFSNILSDYESAFRLGGNEIRWEKALKGLYWYFNLYALSAYEEQSLEDIRNIDAVQITTVHQAKGLEWHVVFIPALVEDKFPSYYVGEKRAWLISRDLFNADRYDLKDDDERRLFYVAVTRAKNVLVLSYYENSKISKFLEEILEKSPPHIEVGTPTTQIEFDGPLDVKDEDEIHTFDAGEIVDYTRCPYFYRLRHVWNYDAPLAEELGFGNALHYCLRRTVELVKNNGYDASKALSKAVSDDFHLPFAPSRKFSILKKSAEYMLEKYVKDNVNDINSVAEVEYRLEFPAYNATIAGKVDVIIDKGGEVEVREYKTSTKVAKPDEVALQVRLYGVGLQKLGYKVTKGSVAYLSEKMISPVDMSESSLRKATEEADRILRSIFEENYEAKVGEFCNNCDYREICRWRKRR